MSRLDPKATRKIISGLVTLGLLVGGVAYLFASSAGEAFEYYKHVDEVMAQPGKWTGKHLQVHGYVVKDSIMQRRGSLDYKFKLETRAPRAPAIIEAEYSGLVPDTFKSDAEVVAKGTITADNRLAVVSDGISAKCPSRYEKGAMKLSEATPSGGAQR